MSGKSPVQKPGDNVREDGRSKKDGRFFKQLNEKLKTFCAFKLKVSNILTGEHVSNRLRSRVRTLFFLSCEELYISPTALDAHQEQILDVHICRQFSLFDLLWLTTAVIPDVNAQQLSKTGCQFTSTWLWHEDISNNLQHYQINHCEHLSLQSHNLSKACLLTALWNCMFIQWPAVLVMTTVRVVARIWTPTNEKKNDTSWLTSSRQWPIWLI